MKNKRAVLTFIMITTVTLSLTLLGGMGAFEQQTKPCGADIKKFCQGVSSGGGRIVQCLKQNKKELSPGCKLQIAKVAEQAKEVHEDCEDDIMTYCADVKPRGGRIANCLTANLDQLSPECKSKISEERD